MKRSAFYCYGIAYGSKREESPGQGSEAQEAGKWPARTSVRTLQLFCLQLWKDAGRLRKSPGGFFSPLILAPPFSRLLFLLKTHLNETPRQTYIIPPLLINPPLCAVNSLPNQPGKRPLERQAGRGQSVCCEVGLPAHRSCLFWPISPQ